MVVPCLSRPAERAPGSPSLEHCSRLRLERCSRDVKLERRSRHVPGCTHGNQDTPPERREEPLSRQRIVEAAIALLDTAGEGALTFRALAERLATGPGAIYWHVTGKDELLNAATDAVIATMTADTTSTAGTAAATPQEAIRTLALGVFDAIDAHPWIGTQLARAPSQSPLLRVFEHLGRHIQTLGVPTPPSSPPPPPC